MLAGIDAVALVRGLRAGPNGLGVHVDAVHTWHACELLAAVAAGGPSATTPVLDSTPILVLDPAASPVAD